MNKINCKYYCKDYPLEGMCKLHLDWSEPMPTVVYCVGVNCEERIHLTNYDRIKRASKTELAEIFMEHEFAVKADCNRGNYSGDKEDWIEWLDREAETE